MDISAGAIINRIKEAIGENWLEALQEDLSLSRSGVYAWQEKKTVPKALHILKICDKYDVGLRYLLTGEEEKELSREERNLLAKWHCLTELGQDTVMAVINTQLSVKREENEINDETPMGKAAGDSQ